MNDLSLTILAETANDAQIIERLHARTFGPGRYVLSAYRLREHVSHLLDLSFTARIGTLLVGSVRQLPICVGDTPALLLGPLTVEPPFRSRGVGRKPQCGWPSRPPSASGSMARSRTSSPGAPSRPRLRPSRRISTSPALPVT